MKIVRIIARLNVGGPARHVALLDSGLRQRGHQTQLAFGALDAGEGSLEAAAVHAGIPMMRIEGLGRSINALSDLRALLALVRLLYREQPDVVHTHTAKAGTLGRLAALVYNATRRRGRRALVVHTFHGHVFEGYFSERVNRLIRATERVLARITDVVITISPRQRYDIVERFAVARDQQVVVVPLGLDLDALLALPPDAPTMRAAIGASSDDIIVGYVGRMVPVKDVPLLIRAFAQASRDVPSLRLLLAGDGPNRSEAEALAAELGRAERVHFIGWTDDLQRFYATIDVFALTSLNEGTPVAGIEAMAAGKPVVATAVGGVPDVVDSGTTGTLIPPGSADAFSRSLVDLARRPDERRRMGAAGRERAGSRYSHVRLVDDVERLYMRELRRKRLG